MNCFTTSACINNNNNNNNSKTISTTNSAEWTQLDNDNNTNNSHILNTTSFPSRLHVSAPKDINIKNISEIKSTKQFWKTRVPMLIGKSIIWQWILADNGSNCNCFKTSEAMEIFPHNNLYKIQRPKNQP
jgi:hypothetical protein